MVKTLWGRLRVAGRHLSENIGQVHVPARCMERPCTCRCVECRYSGLLALSRCGQSQ